MRLSKVFATCASIALLGFALVAPVSAANRVWVGMNGDWNSSNSNWSGNDEPDSDDAAIFNTSHSVVLVNSNESINALNMSGGIDLDLNGNDMTVEGPVLVTGASTNLFVGPFGSVLNADTIAVNFTAVLSLKGGTVTINNGAGDGLFDINPGGTLFGHGIISFTDPVLAGAVLFVNDETLTVTSTAIDGGLTASTLSISASDSDARIDLDGVDENGVVTVARNDTLDIDVPLSDSFGGTMRLSAGATLDIAHAWALGDGDLYADTVGISPGTAGAMATIAGGLFTQNSGAIYLDAIDTLRIASKYTGNAGVLNINGGKLLLHGGGAIGSSVLVNMLNGGAIEGFGTIHAGVNGSPSSAAPERLLADNGMLTLEGEFSNVIVGTADEDGILNVPSPWNTSEADGVTLAGGELRGGTITNDRVDGIRGHGLISARFVNEETIVAEGGGTLVMETSGNDNDWDGSTSMGTLVAQSANLELRDIGQQHFFGNLVVRAGYEAFTNGFELQFQSVASLSIDSGGRYRSSDDVFLNCPVSIQPGAGATLQVDDLAAFHNVTTTLMSDLLLDCGFAVVYPGAKFSGGGALVNAPGRRLALQDGVASADLAVTVVNNGTLRFGLLPGYIDTIAQVGGAEFEQSSTGTCQFDLGGAALGEFDQFALTNAAHLDGTLGLSLLGGYMPTLGQTLDILSAQAGVVGTFATVLQPAGMPFGLKFDVIYNPMLVQLQVVSAPTFAADFDEDGNVDAGDLVRWEKGFGKVSGATHAQGDADGDGDVDGADFLAWQQQLGSGLAAPNGAAIPEPASLLLMTLVAFAVCLRRVRKRQLLHEGRPIRPLGNFAWNAFVALMGFVLAAPARGADRTWVGLNNDWDASDDNWNPADEPDSNDAAILSGNFSVDLANANEAVNGLTMSGGMDLDVNGNDMIVDGLASLSGASTNLFIGPFGSVLTPDAVTVNSGAALALRGGTVTVNEESGDGLIDVNAGGTVSGHGIISFTDAVAAGTKVFINNGALTATSMAIDIGGSTASTLTIGASDADARIDLDGASDSGTVTVSRNDTLDIDVPLSDMFGGTIVLSAGATLDIASAWGSTGVINVNTVGISPGTAGAMATIAGCCFTQNGGSINLDAIDTLRIASVYNAFGGVLNVNGGTLILDGGAAAINAGVNVALQNGGVIRGQGDINADVVGVAADASFEQVLADNGLLELNGDFNNVVIGTADEDGILSIPASWSTNFTQGVTLSGGELRGGVITNNHPSGIYGHGFISATVRNNTRIKAEGGGTLLLETAGDHNEWDGPFDAGILEAATADLELRDDQAITAFSGDVIVASGQEVFTNDFGFRYLGGATLDMRGGSQYRSTYETWFEDCTVFVKVGGIATMEVDGNVRFMAGSTTMLTGSLLLDNTITSISAGAQFSGGGALINAQGSTLFLGDGVASSNLAVSVVNNGRLTVGNGVFGQAAGTDYQQTATGLWDLKISGIGVTEFDRLSLTGTAVLDGTLDLAILLGYVPALGQTLNILSATGGLSGRFATVNQPSNMPAGLKFGVLYNPTLVQLRVTFSADFDRDGDVDAADLVQWQGDFGVNDDSDADNDGDSDGADFLAWQWQLGSAAPAVSANAPVPEPATSMLVIAAVSIRRIGGRMCQKLVSA